MIDDSTSKYRYFDRHGSELHAGDTIRWDDGKLEVLYEWGDGEVIGLGTDATNPVWIQDGRAFECEYGIYPLTVKDTMEIERV